MKRLIPDIAKANPKFSSLAHSRDQEIDTLARTIWGEARGEGSAGMEAVAAVIMNRVKVAESKGSYWWGNTVIGVCRKPWQFSCWNASDPNRERLIAVDEKDLYFATALRIARRAVYGVLPDPTGGATHYHAAGLSPSWIKGQRPSGVIGRHIFYQLVEV
ncbi:MAG: cell wall hydrolase [Rhodospirillales bacterium]|nr:cell wall hydrolase [Rhodospirillales bacterium]